MRRNLPADTDSYKQHHPQAIHPELTIQSTYAECRVGSKYPETCFVGLDPIIKENFLSVPTRADIEEAREIFQLTNGYDGFDTTPWKRVRKLGYLPFEIKAVPEGSVVGVNNVLFTSKSTQPWFAKSLNSLEPLLMHFWYPTSVSTRSMNIKRNLLPLFGKSGSIEGLPYMVNDFGLRGATTFDAAVMGGIGHLVHFRGSDNLPASRMISDYYGVKGRAQSIFATEHSVALSFGPGQGEFNYVNHCLDVMDKNPTFPMAMVIDTYDTMNFLRNVIGSKDISERIKNRPGRVVLRPDSGEPKLIVTQCIEILASIFGYHTNDKGYYVLNHNVGVIQGDGMNETSIIELYEHIMKNRWSCDNLVTGSGGGLLQVDINRDTQRAAIKPSVGTINGQEVLFKKDPKTDPTKGSKTGHLKLHPNYDGTFTTMSSANETAAMFGSYADALKTVYKNGEYLGDNHFSKIIERAETFIN